MDFNNYNYEGMICKKTNRPHGFGRAIKENNNWFYDGQFLDGEDHGY